MICPQCHGSVSQLFDTAAGMMCRTCKIENDPASREPNYVPPMPEIPSASPRPCVSASKSADNTSDHLEISDAQLDRVQEIVNASIHELVHLCNHAEQHDAGDCENILNTLDLNLDQLRTLLAPQTIKTSAS
jgi:hypothetical protein